MAQQGHYSVGKIDCHGGKILSKMLSTQQADDDSGYVFVAKLDNARNVSTILRAIHFKDVRRSFASLCITIIIVDSVSTVTDSVTVTVSVTDYSMTVTVRQINSNCCAVK